LTPARNYTLGRELAAKLALKTRAPLVPAIFLLAISVAFINGYLARYVPIIVPLAMRFVGRRTPKVNVEEQ